MLRVALSLFLGVLSPAAFILGAEVFHNQESDYLGFIAAGIVLFLYLGFFQYLVQPAHHNPLKGRLPVLLAMAAPVLLMALIIALFEKREVFLYQGLPFLGAGACGLTLGLYAACRLKNE